MICTVQASIQLKKLLFLYCALIHSKKKDRPTIIGLISCLTFLADVLSGRQQCVVVEGFQSDCSAVVSGVPQGTVLGPILFLIFINDVTDDPVNKVSLSLFADDLKLYSSVNKCDDLLSLQCALDKLAVWSSEWQLNVNIEKTYILHIGSINSVAKHYL